MIKPLHMPPDAYFDDPADKIDLASRCESQESLILARASDALTHVAEWMTRGHAGAANRALRADIVVLSLRPQCLPTKRPSAAWIAREHGVSRQRVSELWREFADGAGPTVQFRGQRFRNRYDGATQRRGRGRRGRQGPPPGPVAGA